MTLSPPSTDEARAILAAAIEVAEAHGLDVEGTMLVDYDGAPFPVELFLEMVEARLAAGDWTEELHPREHGGRFAVKDPSERDTKQQADPSKLGQSPFWTIPGPRGGQVPAGNYTPRAERLAEYGRNSGYWRERLQAKFPNATVSIGAGSITPDNRELREIQSKHANTATAAIQALENCATDYPEVAAAIQHIDLSMGRLDAMGYPRANGLWQGKIQTISVDVGKAHGAEGYAVATHEFGHALDYVATRGNMTSGTSTYNSAHNTDHVSMYAAKNSKEYFAEAFNAARLGYDRRLTTEDKDMLNLAARRVGSTERIAALLGAADVPDGFNDTDPEDIPDDFDGSIEEEWLTTLPPSELEDDFPDEAQQAAAEPVQIAPPGTATALRRLTELRRSLGTRLIAAAEQVYEEALRAAGAKFKTRARSRTSSTRQRQVIAAVEAREPLRPYLAAVGLREDELLRDAFTVFRKRALREFQDYRTAVVAVVSRFPEHQRIELRSEAESAVDFLVAGLTAMVRSRLLDGEQATLAAAAPKMAPRAIPQPTGGDVLPGLPDPDELSRAAARLVRNALDVHEGRAEWQFPTTPDQMPNLTYISGAGTAEHELAVTLGVQPIWTWAHGFYGEAATVLDGHDRLDGFTTNDPSSADNAGDPDLANDEPWPYFDYYFPDDHDGCTCEWIIDPGEDDAAIDESTAQAEIDAASEGAPPQEVDLPKAQRDSPVVRLDSPLAREANQTNTLDAFKTIHEVTYGYNEAAAVADDLALDTVTERQIASASKAIYDASQTAMARDGFPEQFIVYRSVRTADETGIVSVSYRPTSTFGEQQAYAVNRADVLTYGEGIQRGSFAEAELQVDASKLRPL